MEREQNKGRRKIGMKKIEKNDDKLMAFSKRKSGIYKKACELSAACGVEVGVVIFSPSDKPHSFATSTMENVINRFFHQNHPPQNKNSHIIQSLPQVRINKLNERYNNLYSKVRETKSKGKLLNQTRKQINEGWWNAEIEDLSLEECYKWRSSLRVLHKKLSDHINGRTQSTSSTLPSILPEVSN